MDRSNIKKFLEQAYGKQFSYNENRKQEGDTKLKRLKELNFYIIYSPSFYNHALDKKTKFLFWLGFIWTGIGIGEFIFKWFVCGCA